MSKFKSDELVVLSEEGANVFLNEPLGKIYVVSQKADIGANNTFIKADENEENYTGAIVPDTFLRHATLAELKAFANQTKLVNDFVDQSLSKDT